MKKISVLLITLFCTISVSAQNPSCINKTNIDYYTGYNAGYYAKSAEPKIIFSGKVTQIFEFEKKILVGVPLGKNKWKDSILIEKNYCYILTDRTGKNFSFTQDQLQKDIKFQKMEIPKIGDDFVIWESYGILLSSRLINIAYE